MTEPTEQDEAEPSLPERQEAFLHLIEAHGIADKDAYEIIGVTRWTLWRWKKDPEFLARYKEARKISMPHLEEEAKRRAMGGSDRLLEFLLCNYDPERFSSKHRVEHAGAISLVVATGVPADDGSDLAG